MATHPEIQAAIDAISVVDTHEHLEEETQRLARPLDFFSLYEQYSVDDLRVAGMPASDVELCMSSDTPPEQKWRLFESHYRAAKNTAYVRAVDIAIRDLYDIDALDADSALTLTARIRERNRPGVLKWILRDCCGIDHAQVNALGVLFFPKQTDRSLFRQDLLVVQFVQWPIPFDELARETDVAIDSFGQYGAAIDALFDKHASQACAIKQQSAYWRPQNFDNIPDATAERAFDAARRDAESVSAAERKQLQDWSYHRCIRNAIDHRLPIKIHTGYKVGAGYMDLNDIPAAKLNNLFIQYPSATFSLFHISYPYQNEALALAKHFPNVYLDMCWAWILDLEGSRQFLRQFLTAVPANKLFAFGGDYTIAEPVYGHLRLARDGIARVLSEFVEEDYFSINEAIAIGERILRENALDIFGENETASLNR